MSDIAALLERYRRGPELLAVILTGVYVEEEDFALPGNWTGRQIVAEEYPTLIAYDQDAWAARLDYARRKPKQSLETFRRVRAENYELLKDLPPEAFDRAGNHTERGRVTLRELLEGYAGHAESHARQLQSIRDEYQKVKGKK